MAIRAQTSSQAGSAKWTTRKAVKLIYEAKEKTPCSDCGKIFHPCQTEFDHVPGRGPKLFNLGIREARAFDELSIRREMAKCDLVCRNCHAMRGWKRAHGKFEPKLGGGFYSRKLESGSVFI